MRQLTIKIIKSMGRITVCSIGGLFIIMGIILGLGVLIRLPEGVSKHMPYVVISILTLSVGLFLCFLVIKPMRYFAKTRKMSKEEKTIESIKKYLKIRKSHIAALIFILVLYISLLVFLHLHGNRLVKTITSEDIKLLNLVKLFILEYFFLGLTGLFIGSLIIEISGLNRNKHILTLNMWERIRQLENEIKELKAGTHTDEQ